MNEFVRQLRDLNLDIEQCRLRKEEIKKLAREHRDTITSEKVDAGIAEARKINDELTALEERKKELQSKIDAENNKESRGENKMNNEHLINNEERDARVKSFAETRRVKVPVEEVRSVLLASEGIAKPTKVNGIENPFNTNISILDQVKVIDMTGAGAFKESFLKTHSSGTAKTDGVAQDASDPVFGTVTITPAEVAVTTYVSKELEKVTPLNYLAKVQESALVGLKVKLAQDILTKIKSAKDDATTASNMFETLTATAANGMLSSGQSPAGKIDDKTLRNIALNYGGDANVYGNAVLYLNKTDLIAFGDVRGTNEKKAVYEITPDASNPNVGIIKDGGLAVPYCICPSLTALSGTAQPASNKSDAQTMIYGSPLNYELALFGDYSIEASRDYKFAEGLISILGSVTVGGNVVVPNGFVVVTIPKASA